MRVYHGSYTEIGKIDYERCRMYRDFGLKYINYC